MVNKLESVETLQLRITAMAQAAHANGQELPALSWRYARWWEGLGYPAVVAMLAIFYLMVAKPDLYGPNATRVNRELDAQWLTCSQWPTLLERAISNAR